MEKQVFARGGGSVLAKMRTNLVLLTTPGEEM